MLVAESSWQIPTFPTQPSIRHWCPETEDGLYTWRISKVTPVHEVEQQTSLNQVARSSQIFPTKNKHEVLSKPLHFKQNSPTPKWSGQNRQIQGSDPRHSLPFIPFKVIKQNETLWVWNKTTQHSNRWNCETTKKNALSTKPFDVPHHTPHSFHWHIEVPYVLSSGMISKNLKPTASSHLKIGRTCSKKEAGPSSNHPIFQGQTCCLFQGG